MRDLNFRNRAVISRVAPFALFMSFVGVDEVATLLDTRGWIHLAPASLLYLYPVKILAVALMLYCFRGAYEEVRLKDLACLRTTGAAVVLGGVTCILWVLMDWTAPINAAPRGFIPLLLPEGPVRVVMTLFRVGGAVLVVPFMEEVFWRSFLLRYLVDPRFEAVPIGAFTLGSFAATTVLFGLEHHFIVAGMVAGALYTMFLYRTRSIAQCILSHSVTNLSLAVYVLLTGKWHFW